MKYQLKRFMKSIVAAGLCLTMFATGTNIVSACSVDTPETTYVQVQDETAFSQQDFMDALDDYAELGDLSNNGNLQLVYDEMTDSAKEIFLQYLATDDELLAFHKENICGEVPEVEENYSSDSFVIKPVSYASASVASAASDTLSILTKNLNAISGMTDAVRYALVAAGSSILAAASSLTVGKIVAILVAAGCAGVLIANWDYVSEHWDAIVKAFKKTFKAIIDGDSMGQAFGEAKPTYCSVYSEIAEVRGTYRNGKEAKSFDKHIDRELTSSIIKKKQPLGLYYSRINKTALITYVIGSGVKGNLNRDYNAHSTYQLQNFDLSGAKLFVLYSLKNHTLFHAHIRLFRDDTETMRYANKMSFQILPYMYFDDKYEIGPGQTWLYGDIFTR